MSEDLVPVASEFLKRISSSESGIESEQVDPFQATTALDSVLWKLLRGNRTRFSDRPKNV